MKKIALLASVATVMAATAAEARDPIAAGSSTVFPFASAAIERAHVKYDMAMVYDSVGTGGGFRKFCAGVGEEHTDFSGASRAIKSSEVSDCEANGVEFTELKIGFDGIAFANSQEGPDLSVSRAQLYQALAAEVPVNGQMVPNPYQKWSDLDPNLPAVEIAVIGPPPTSGTRDAWVELVMEEGCAEAGVEDTDNCGKMREDGRFVEAGENDNVIVQRLQQDPNAFGIFGYSFLEENADSLQGATIDGVEPGFDAIADGSYPVSRPLFLYVKNAHVKVIPKMGDFLDEITSEAAFGDEGYLVDIGLIPLPMAQREATRETMAGLK